MAVDTLDKRASAGSLPWLAIAPTPDGTIDGDDRIQVAGLYRLVAATPPVVDYEIDTGMKGTEYVRAGDTVPIRVQMYDGSTAKTGLTVNVSIERISDGQYWADPAWQAGYIAQSMSELSGDTHLDGMYEYDFVTPTTAGVFDWAVRFTGVIERAFYGRIDTLLLSKALPELSTVPGATPTRDEADMLAYQHLKCETTSGGGAGSEQLKIRNDAGVVVVKGDESKSGGTFTKAKLVAGP